MRLQASLAVFGSPNHAFTFATNRVPHSILVAAAQKPISKIIPSPPLLQITELSPPHLTTSELSLILHRRLENLHLPETPHLLLAERITIIFNSFAALMFKVYLLQTTPAKSLRELHPNIFSTIRFISLLQLPAPRLLIRPLFSLCPVFSWILAPFRAMSVAFLLDGALRAVRTRVQRRLTPAPPRPVVVELNALRDHVREGFEASRVTLADFMSERMSELEKLRNEVEQKLRHEVELKFPPPMRPEMKLPPSMRPDTPGIPGVSFRTPIKGGGFVTPVGTRQFRGIISPRKGLVALSKDEELTNVTSPGMALLPRSIARSFGTPRAGASPPDGSPPQEAGNR